MYLASHKNKIKKKRKRKREKASHKNYNVRPFVNTNYAGTNILFLCNKITEHITKSRL